MRQRVAAARAGRSRARRRRVNVAHGQLGRLELGRLPRQAAPLRSGAAAGAARAARFASVLSRSGPRNMSRPARRTGAPASRVSAPRRQQAADAARPGARRTHRRRGAAAGGVLQALASPTAWPRRGAAWAEQRLRAPALDVRHAAPGPRSAALREQARFYSLMPARPAPGRKNTAPDAPRRSASRGLQCKRAAPTLCDTQRPLHALGRCAIVWPRSGLPPDDVIIRAKFSPRGARCALRFVRLCAIYSSICSRAGHLTTSVGRAF